MVKNLSAGDNLPDYFNVVVEISARSGPVKYEIDKDTGILVVDRFRKVVECTSYLCCFFPIILRF